MHAESKTHTPMPRRNDRLLPPKRSSLVLRACDGTPTAAASTFRRSRS